MYKDRIWYKEIVSKTKLRFINSPQTEDDVYTKSWQNTHYVECYVYDSLGSCFPPRTLFQLRSTRLIDYTSSKHINSRDMHQKCTHISYII